MVFWGLLVVFARHRASVYISPTLGTHGEGWPSYDSGCLPLRTFPNLQGGIFPDAYLSLLV
jgi:hypothetical protein